MGSSEFSSASDTPVPGGSQSKSDQNDYADNSENKDAGDIDGRNGWDTDQDRAARQTLAVLQRSAEQAKRATDLAQLYLGRLSVDREEHEEHPGGSSTVIGFYYLARACEHSLKILEACDQITEPTSCWAAQGAGARQAASVTRLRIRERVTACTAGRMLFEQRGREGETQQERGRDPHEGGDEIDEALPGREKAAHDPLESSLQEPGETPLRCFTPPNPGFWFE